MPKTGSTFLQQDVFPKIRNINYACEDTVRFKDFMFKDDMINLFSGENLIMDANYNLSFDEVKKVYERYPQLKVIVVFRGGQSWIKSLYNQYVRNGGTSNYIKWFSEVDREFLEKNSIINELKKISFDVLALDFGELKSNSHGFVEKICDFIGVGVPIYTNNVHGKSLPSWAIYILRFTNHFIILSKWYVKFRRWRLKHR